MHDPAYTKHLVRTIEAVARNYNAPRVTTVQLWLGARAGVGPAPLRRQFQREAAGTAVEGAKLDLEVSPDPEDPNAGEILILSIELAKTQPAA